MDSARSSETFQLPTILRNLATCHMLGTVLKDSVSSHVCMEAEAHFADCSQGMARFKGH